MKDTRFIMSDLAAYGIARERAKEEASETDQTGTPVFGFESDGPEFEIITGSPEDLAEYNVDFAIYATDAQSFNMIVRKDNDKALHKLPKDKQRSALSLILDSV